jgi:hypothetical protein
MVLACGLVVLLLVPVVLVFLIRLLLQEQQLLGRVQQSYGEKEYGKQPLGTEH